MTDCPFIDKKCSLANVDETQMHCQLCLMGELVMELRRLRVTGFG